MRHVLAEMQPLDPVTGERVTLRVCSADDRVLTGIGGERWWPAITDKPTRSIQLFDGDFSSDVQPATSAMTVLVDKLQKLDPDAGRFRWASAPVRIMAGANDDAWPWAPWFVGLVDGFEGPANKLKLRLKVDTRPFDADVLSLAYAGTGGAEGGADLKGQAKPLIFGRARSVEGVLIDVVNSVIQYSAYGPINAVYGLFERGSQYTGSIGDFADYAALVAANIPAGSWATCLALGMVRLGAPPQGVITADIQGHWHAGTWPRLTGAIIARVCALAAVDTDLIDAVSLAALDAAVPYPANIVINEQISVLDLAKRLARGCNAQAGVSWTGQLFVTRPSLAAPIFTLDAQGRQRPQVLDSTESDVSAPYWRVSFGADRCWRVHTIDEIASDYVLVPRGRYDPLAVYRQGNYVDLEDGSQWMYVNPSPEAGHFPAEDAWWDSMSPALDASGIRYLDDDGNPAESVQYYKPAEPGADVTGNNTANDTAHIHGVPSEDMLAELAANIELAGEIRDRTDDIVARELTNQLAFLGANLTLESLRQRIEDLGHVDGQRVATAIRDVAALLETTDATVSANYLELIDAVVSETEARVEALSLLETNFSSDITDVQASVAAESVARSDAVSAEAATRSALIASLTDDIHDTNAAVVAEAVARGDAVSAEATARTTLAATVGTQGGVITDLKEVLVDPQSGVSTKAVLGLAVGNKVVGYVASNDGSTGRIVYQFDSYTLLDTDDNVMIFASGGQVYMPNVIIGRLDVGVVTTNNVAANAITGMASTSSSSVIVGSGHEEWHTALTIGFSLDFVADVLILATGRNGNFGSTREWACRVRLDGGDELGAAAGAGAYTDSFSLHAPSGGVGTGSHTAYIEWFGFASDITLQAIAATVFYRKR